jgi:mycothiol system anti-sigma-R factor
MNCTEAFEQLYRFLDSDCTEKTQQEVDRHLTICRECWDVFEFEKRLRARVQQSCCQEPASDRLLKRVQQLIDRF